MKLIISLDRDGEIYNIATMELSEDDRAGMIANLSVGDNLEIVIREESYESI